MASSEVTKSSGLHPFAFKLLAFREFCYKYQTLARLQPYFIDSLKQEEQKQQHGSGEDILRRLAAEEEEDDDEEVVHEDTGVGPSQHQESPQPQLGPPQPQVPNVRILEVSESQVVASLLTVGEIKISVRSQITKLYAQCNAHSAVHTDILFLHVCVCVCVSYICMYE